MTVREMSSLVHPPSAIHRVMAVLKAYFDESGFEGPVFSLCGFVATERTWDGFDQKWTALLARPCLHTPRTRPEAIEKICRPLRSLHATDMEGLGKGRFRRIGQRNRDYLINSSMKVILDSGIVGIGTGVIIAGYDTLPDATKAITGSPYLMCMRYILQEVAKHASMFMGETEDIAYIFENQPVWEIKAHQLFAGLREQHQKDFRMGTIAFGSKEKFRPLQAADRFAFEFYQHFVDRTTERQNWIDIVRHPLFFGKYCD